MRKWFILFITALFPLAISADETVEYEGLWYNLHDATEEGSSAYAEVISSQNGGSYSGDIVIPSSVINGDADYPVTRVGNDAFYYCTEVTSVSFPVSLESIGDYAFYENYNLKVVELPEGLTTIGVWAFGYVGGAIGGVKVVLPSTLTSIGECAFQTNNTISVVTSNIITPFDINENVFGSGTSAFLLVPSNTKSAYQALAGWNVFDGIYEGDYGEASDGTLSYRYFTSENIAVVIPGEYSGLQKVTIPGSVTLDGTTYPVKAVGTRAFNNCTSLDSLIIEEGVETIGNSAFEACYNLRYLVLPEGLKTIGSRAFVEMGSWWSSAKSKLVLPSTLTSIGEEAFSYARSLSLVVSKLSSPFAINKNVFCNGWHYEDETQIFEKSDATLYVPDGTKSTYLATEGWDMFADILEGDPVEATVDDLKYLYVVSSKTATVVGRAEDSSNNNLTIPSMVPINGEEYSVKAIGNGALRDIGIESLVISSGVETIGKEAFISCWRLRKVELPSTITSIGDQAFYGMGSLATVISRISSPFEIDKSVFANGQYSHYDESGNYISDYQKSPAILYIPDGTASAYKAIDGWNMFADIVEGELKEITYEGLNYTYIEGKGTATVVGRADDELRNISIPGSITIGSSTYIVKAVGTSAFQGCNLESLVIGEGVETIGKNAFRENWNIRSVVLPNSLRTIGEYAFFSCEYQLKKIEMPASLDSIGDYAFSRLNNLSTVVSRIQTPFKISESVFSLDENWDYSGGTSKRIFTKSPATLYVPDGTSSAYKAIDGWNMFAEIVEGELKETTYEGLNYTYVEGKGIATVVGRENTEMRKISIPATIPVDNVNYSVKAVAPGAFRNINIDTLIIASGIETIGKNAFYYCWNLKKVELPSTLKIIADQAFYDCDNLKRIELPLSLDSIGRQAFYSCDNLMFVVSKIQTPFAINTDVFVNNGSKSNAILYVPVGTTSAYQQYDGWNVFSEIIEGEPKEVTYEGLTYNYFENNGTATVIGRADDNLTKISIPGVIPIDGSNYSVTTIGVGAFQNCTNVDTLVVQSGVETISKNAFMSCYYLKSITISEGVKIIGENAFRECGTWNNASMRVDLPSSLDSIGNYAFYCCRNLSSVVSKIQNPFVISESVFASSWETYQDGVATWPKSSANLYVPEGTKARYEAIAGWNMFAAIYEGEIKEYESDSLKYAYLMSNLTATVIASDKYRNYSAITIPGTVIIDGIEYKVTEIGANAFKGCSDLRNVTISDGVQTIGNGAFQECYSAYFEQLPSSLRTIGDNAFRWCQTNTQRILPEGLLSIGKWAFSGCYYMQKVVLPSTLTSIDEYAFRDNSNLATVISHISRPFAINNNVFGSESKWNEETQQYDYTCAADLYVPEGTIDQYKSMEGWTVFSNIYEGELKDFTYLDLVYTYNTSSKVATVVKGENYDSLKIVSIPSKIPVEGTEYPVKAIAGRAFSSTSITSVEIADGLETIGQEAFSNCEQLSRLSLPSTLVTIESSAFNNCRRLAGITIPASVKTIGNNALSGCYNLETIEVADGNEAYESLGSNVIIERKTKTLLLGCKNSTIPDGVAAIGALAFNNCQIEKIQFPETVKSIGDNAFASCRYLTEVILPEGLDSIAYGAFRNCELLETIEFPTTMKFFGEEAFNGCHNLMNVVSNIENPKEISESVFGYGYSSVYSQATLWVPKGKIDSYKGVSAWNLFKSYDELLHDILTKPTITYDGHYLVMTNNPDQRAKIYYSTDGTEPTILYNDTIAMSNLAAIQAISKRFGSYTVDTARYEITYVYDGVTARTATGGLLKNAFEWCGTDKIEMLDIDGQLNDEDFATIRGLSKLTVLNMAASKIENSSIPSEAFANMNLEWYVSPYNFTSVGSGIFKGCDKLAALTWNSSSIELPEDVVTDVANPNMLVYAKAQSMIPYAMKNVIVNGVANNIVLVDSAGNNNFRCPEEFLARRITYTHNYQQETKQGQTQGWETLALPFTVSKITHETKGEITPFAVEGAERPFWLYELGGNGMEKATEIRANTPYLICMPNDDAYGDEYILGGRVTFSATNVTITTSGGTTVSRGDRQFVPTYQRVASSSDVYALNVNEIVGDNPVGSVFVQSLREVRPFEAYSVHSTNRARIITVSSLGGGDATGINDLIQNNAAESADGVVKVYSLSGALIKQGKREEVLRSLPNGLYIINGKKIIK